MHLSILKAFNPDILVEMLKTAYSFEQWNKLLYTADILHNYAQRIYEERQYYKARGLTSPLIKMQHPLVYYFGFSQQMRGIAYQQLGDYEQAEDSIYRYAELGWLEDLGKEGLEIAREFRFLAKVNLYAVEILSGKTELLNDYVRFVQTYPKGIPDGLVVIMQAALCYDLNVDEQLRLLTDEITGIKSEQDGDVQSKYRRFCYLRGLYNRRMAKNFVVESCRVL
ncbi:DNA-binding protein [Paenibacillus sp. sgz500992]|uniref:DNA-binding protein n=1 Tax=Paenibacillus sp. sgz500992 TaxID=3242476 RepID=UPI0036D3654C